MPVSIYWCTSLYPDVSCEIRAIKISYSYCAPGVYCIFPSGSVNTKVSTCSGFQLSCGFEFLNRAQQYLLWCALCKISKRMCNWEIRLKRNNIWNWVSAYDTATTSWLVQLDGYHYYLYNVVWELGIRALIHKADGRLTARSREVSKPRDSCLDFSNRSEIWQAPRQQCCRDACQISERCDHYNIQSRGFET